MVAGRVYTLMAAAFVLVFGAACLGGGTVEAEGCRCTVELPSGWEDHDQGGRLYANDFDATSGISAEFYDRESIGVNSAPVLLDAWLLEDYLLPPRMAPHELIDGRVAATRRVSDRGTERWAAMVPYDDGWVFVEAWHEGGEPDGLEGAIEVARTLSRSAVGPVVAPSEIEPLPQAGDYRAIREQLTVFDDPEAGGLTVQLGGPVAEVRSLSGELVHDQWIAEITVTWGDEPTPTVVYLTRGEPDSDVRSALRVLHDRGVSTAVFRVPEPGPDGPEGVRVTDLAASIVSMLSQHERLDGDRLYLVAHPSAARAGLFLAMEADVRAVILLGGELLAGEGPEPLSYLENLKAPVWGLFGELGAADPSYPLLQMAAQHATMAVHAHMVPRATQDVWPALALSALAGRIVADGGEGDRDGDGDGAVDLGLDAALAYTLGRRAWERRWPELAAQVRFRVEGYRRTGLLRRARIASAVSEGIYGVDHRTTRDHARRLMLQAPASPMAREPSPQAVALRAALSALHHEGFLVRPALPGSQGEYGLATTLEASERPGFVYARAEQLLASVRWGLLLELRFGDALPRDPNGTRRVGRRVVRALTEAGLEPLWSEDPSSPILVPVSW